MSIPFETDLRPGPQGDLVQVVDYDAANDCWYLPVDLNDPYLLAQGGMRPSETDPRSHQQIVYAITMSVLERFQRYTGRLRWRASDRLRIVPHAFYGRNAYYDPARGALLFGYYDTDEFVDFLPGQWVYTCLSADIIAHEVTHAILDRLRPDLRVPTNIDAHAIHEGLADLVALFNHFAFPEAVADAVAQSRSNLGDAQGLLSLAMEFGISTGRGRALRSALNNSPDPWDFRDATEPHERGAIFVSAVFDAYLEMYQTAIADLRRLATGGSGVLREGDLSPDLVTRATAEAVAVADRILGVIVRGIDYLPPVDVTFGDVIRAVVTADRDLFPDDTKQVRERIVVALRRRGISPAGIAASDDDALAWPIPSLTLSLVSGTAPIDLSLVMFHSAVQHDPSAANPELGHSDQSQLYGQAHRWAAAHAFEIGLDPAVAALQLRGFHSGFQRGADGRPRTRIWLQIGQRRRDLEDVTTSDTPIPIWAGTTVVADLDGSVLYLIVKPLPFASVESISELVQPLRAQVEEWHEAGVRRLQRMHDWFGSVESADPLSGWVSGPAVARLTFANLHSEF